MSGALQRPVLHDLRRSVALSHYPLVERRFVRNDQRNARLLAAGDCLAHLEPEPCQTCAAHIAGGL